MVRKLVVVVVSCVAVVAAGCGDDGTSRTVTVEGKPYVDAMTSSLADHGAGEIELSAVESGCIAPKWVNILDPERLDEAGVEPAQLALDQGIDQKAAKVSLTDGEITKLVDAFGECQVDLTRSFVRSLTEGATLAADDEACLVDALPDDLVRRMVAVEVTKGVDGPDEDPNLMAELFQALSACPGAIDLGS